MRRSLKLCIILLFLASVAPGFCLSPLDVMDKYSGPRAMAMGGAFVAVADDLNAPYWNPAGLARSASNQIGTTYANFFEMVDRLSFDAIYQLPDPGLSLGLNYVQEGMQNIPKTEDIGGNGIQTGSFEEYKRAFNVGLAKEFSPGFYQGLNARFLYNTLDNESAYGSSIDAGWLWDIEGDLYFGLVAKNVLSKLEWSTKTSEYLERKLLTGIALKEKLFGLSTVLALDYEVNAFSHNKWYTGLELWLAEDSFAFRFGTNSDQNWTFGTGLRYGNFICDLCYRDQQYLGAEYLLSLGFDFDPGARKKEQKKRSGLVSLSSEELNPGDPLVIMIKDPEHKFQKVAVSLFEGDKVRKMTQTKEGYRLTYQFKEQPPLYETRTAKVFLQDVNGEVQIEYLPYKYLPKAVQPTVSLAKKNWYLGEALEIKMQVPKGTPVRSAIVEFDEFNIFDLKEVSPGEYILHYPLSEKLKYGTYAARVLVKIEDQAPYQEKISFQVIPKP